MLDTFNRAGTVSALCSRRRFNGQRTAACCEEHIAYSVQRHPWAARWNVRDQQVAPASRTPRGGRRRRGPSPASSVRAGIVAPQGNSIERGACTAALGVAACRLQSTAHGSVCDSPRSLSEHHWSVAAGRRGIQVSHLCTCPPPRCGRRGQGGRPGRCLRHPQEEHPPTMPGERRPGRGGGGCMPEGNLWRGRRLRCLAKRPSDWRV